MLSVLPILFFYAHCRNNRYVEAIASCQCVRYIPSSRRVWSQYRLGLYETISKACNNCDDWRTGIATAVSLAACGRHIEAREIVSKCEKRYGKRNDFHVLAEAVAPFMPKLALEITDGKQIPTALHAALLQRNGKQEESSVLLQNAFDKDAHFLNPELYLYLSNAKLCGHHERIAYLNAFLLAKGLSPVKVSGSDCFPAPNNNLSSASDLTYIKGGPLVTVLMTAHQSASFISSAIRSILCQTWENLELIIVNDASEDNTGEIIKEWELKDSRVRLVFLQQNVGTYVAKNIGLQYAKGEFVTCHDSDDWSHPLKIERQVTPLLRNRKLVGTISDWVRMQDDGTYYARPVHPLQRLNPSSPLFRRKEVLEKTGAWDCVRTGADSEFAARLKIVFGRKAVLRIREPLSFGAHRPDSLMTGSTTGYTENRVPPDRLDYWESWTYWHIEELRAGRKPRMPGLLEERAFNAPFSILVPRDHITSNLETTLFQCT